MERLAADFPAWRIECTTGGTRYYSAHKGVGEDSMHLGSPSARGLRAMLERHEGGTIADLGAQVAEAGY
jgi:hypothetical protein